MKTWTVAVRVTDYIEVEAETREQAEKLALEEFDPTANDPYVYESYTEEDDDL